jgi:MinD superfamily P-loop ATPase
MIQHPQPPKVPQINDELCQACSKCAARKACKTKAILALDPGEPPFVDANLCYGCLVCVPACPFEAVAA